MLFAAVALATRNSHLSKGQRAEINSPQCMIQMALRLQNGVDGGRRAKRAQNALENRVYRAVNTLWSRKTYVSEIPCKGINPRHTELGQTPASSWLLCGVVSQRKKKKAQGKY